MVECDHEWKLVERHISDVTYDVVAVAKDPDDETIIESVAHSGIVETEMFVDTMWQIIRCRNCDEEYNLYDVEVTC